MSDNPQKVHIQNTFMHIVHIYILSMYTILCMYSTLHYYYTLTYKTTVNQSIYSEHLRNLNFFYYAQFNQFYYSKKKQNKTQ